MTKTISVDHAFIHGRHTPGPCTLSIDAGRITHILPHATPGPDHMPDVLLTPAFINAHTHLAMCCFRGLNVETATHKNVVEDLFFLIESHMTADDVRAFTRMGAYESILHGVGLVWEHYYHGQALADAIAQTGLCGVVAPTLQDLSGPGTSQLDEQLQTTLDLGTQAWAERGIWSALGPHATDTVSPELWTRIATMASQHDLPIHAHVAQSLEEFERAMARHGTTPVQHLHQLGLLEGDIPHFLLVHAIYTSQADLELLDATRHTLGYCPFSQFIFAFPAHVTRWQEQGLRWIAATDAAASNDSMNVQKELRHIAGLRTSATASSQAYETFALDPTLDHARAAQQHRSSRHSSRKELADEAFLLSRIWATPGSMHPAFEAGSIKVGALANLITWDMHHPHMWPATHPHRALAMGDTTQAIANMMTLGKWLGTHHNYHRSILDSEAYRDAHREANARFDALKRRARIAP